MLNIPLLAKVMDHIEAHPEEHKQGMWADRTNCGTTYCFAGHAVVMTGHVIGWPEESNWETCSWHLADGAKIRDAARRELGLTDEQADLLFDATNSRYDLRRLVDDFITEAEAV